MSLAGGAGPTDHSIAQLIRQLGQPHFGRRERAADGEDLDVDLVYDHLEYHQELLRECRQNKEEFLKRIHELGVLYA